MYLICKKKGTEEEGFPFETDLNCIFLTDCR